MNDLVESLRRLGEMRVPDSLYIVAADEIERLRKVEAAAKNAEPVAWAELTDEEISKVGKDYVEDKYILPHGFARAIEAKLKEKNARAGDDYEAIAVDREMKLRNELAESQTREAKLREYLELIADPSNENLLTQVELAVEALSMPYNDTALKEYRKQVLLEAANKLASDWQYAHGDPADAIRRMAEE